MLGQGLNKRHHAPLGIEPCISSKLLLERLQTFNDSADTEVVVTLRAIKCTDNQVNDTKMEHLLVWLLDSYSVFLLLNTLHEFFGIGILTGHNI